MVKILRNELLALQNRDRHRHIGGLFYTCWRNVCHFKEYSGLVLVRMLIFKNIPVLDGHIYIKLGRIGYIWVIGGSFAYYFKKIKVIIGSFVGHLEEYGGYFRIF